MKRVADGVYLLKGFPPNVMNVYLMEDVVLDAATRYGARRILRELGGAKVTAHALTHGHPDHQGSSKAVCDAYGVPLWCGEGDAGAVERGDMMASARNTLRARLVAAAWGGPAHPVARRLKEGDEVGGFRVLEAPGHSPGSVAYWRESDRTLLVGDVILNIDTRTGRPGLHDAAGWATVDPVRCRVSARRLAELEPMTVLFGHGPPVTDTGRFVRFVASLPR